LASLKRKEQPEADEKELDTMLKTSFMGCNREKVSRWCWCLVSGDSPGDGLSIGAGLEPDG